MDTIKIMVEHEMFTEAVPNDCKLVSDKIGEYYA